MDSRTTRARLRLIGELHAGTRAPGAAISVKKTAEELRISQTPVREALARLAGEELVTLTGDRNGFAVPRLARRDLVELLELCRLLVSASMTDRPVVEPPPGLVSATTVEDPAIVTEHLIAWSTMASASSRISRLLGRLGVMLAPYRRVEPHVIPDWPNEIVRLVDEVRAGRMDAMKDYWQLRIDEASSIIDAVERTHERPNIFQI